MEHLPRKLCQVVSKDVDQSWEEKKSARIDEISSIQNTKPEVHMGCLWVTGMQTAGEVTAPSSTPRGSLARTSSGAAEGGGSRPTRWRPGQQKKRITTTKRTPAPGEPIAGTTRKSSGRER